LSIEQRRQKKITKKFLKKMREKEREREKEKALILLIIFCFMFVFAVYRLFFCCHENKRQI
jgi:uncharacterized ion transporter superfamily protein YfcC